MPVWNYCDCLQIIFLCAIADTVLASSYIHPIAEALVLICQLGVFASGLGNTECAACAKGLNMNQAKDSFGLI